MISVLITSCTSHLKYIEDSINSVSDHADFLIVGYDNHGGLPHVSIINQCDVFFTGIPKGKQPGETYSIKRGLGIARDVSEYVFKMTGDAIITKPEGLLLLPELLGENDIISAQWNTYGSTLLFFGKTDSIYDAVKNIPEVNFPQIEKRLYHSIRVMGYKHKVYPMEHEQGETGNNGIWGEFLGYKHLHRERKGEV